MKKLINNLISKIILKNKTDNLGVYVITDDKIICHVDGEKLKSQSIGQYGYNLIFHDIKSNAKKIPKNLAKPMHYIIENTVFDKRINFLISPCSNIIFKNCTFKEGIFIDGRDIDFVDCKYEACEKSEDNLIPEEHFYIMTIGCYVQNIKFVDTILRIKNVSHPTINLFINAKNIELNNTNIIGVNSLELNCDKLTLNKSSITSRKTKISAKTIKEHNSAVITVKMISSEEAENVLQPSSDSNLNYDEINNGIYYDSENRIHGKKLIKTKGKDTVNEK